MIGARGDSCLALDMVASTCACGNDSFKPMEDKNGSSFAAEFDLRWYPGVIVSDFTLDLYSVSAFS